MAAVTFALGAYAVWGSTFYQRVRGMDGAQAGIWIGVLTAVAGLVGIVLGTWRPTPPQVHPAGLPALAGFAVAIAVPCVLAPILEPDRTTSLGLLFVATVLMASVLGPCNTVTANVVPANRRAAGYALCIFLVHLFGDISSPLFIGLSPSYSAGRSSSSRRSADGSNRWGPAPPRRPRPGPTNLTVGMLAVVPVLALGSLLFLRGARTLPDDQDRARKAGGPDGIDEPVFH